MPPYPEVGSLIPDFSMLKCLVQDTEPKNNAVQSVCVCAIVSVSDEQAALCIDASIVCSNYSIKNVKSCVYYAASPSPAHSRWKSET